MISKKILLAENEKIIALDLKNILTANNYNVVDVLFNSSLILSYMVRQKPDLLITGIKSNVNAVPLFKVITEQYNVPVLIITGVPDHELAEFKKISMCSFLKKPYQREDLLKAVSNSLTPGEKLT